MKKIFALVLLVCLFGCGHSTVSSKTAVTHADSNPVAQVKIGGFVFTKPAGWSMRAEYKCIRYWNKPVDFDSKRTPMLCLVREMRSPSGSVRIKVQVTDIGNPRRTATQLCEWDESESENCYRDTKRVVLYRNQAKLIFMVFFSNPHTEVMVEDVSSSEMTSQEEWTFASLVGSIKPQ